jgi:hypothetical protein
MRAEWALCLEDTLGADADDDEDDDEEEKLVTTEVAEIVLQLAPHCLASARLPRAM